MTSAEEVSRQQQPKKPSIVAKRFHMELPGDAKERLVRMRDRAQLTTLTDVARDALQLYEYLFEEYMDHNADFFIRREGSDIEKVRLFRFSRN